MSTPWWQMLKSPAVWAIIASNVTSDWGIYTMLTNIPTYMYDVLKFDMSSVRLTAFITMSQLLGCDVTISCCCWFQNGLFSALPFLGMWGMMTVAPPVSDKLQSSGLLSTANTRKVCNSVGEDIHLSLLVSFR